jgi:hypothetical protein
MRRHSINTIGYTEVVPVHSVHSGNAALDNIDYDYGDKPATESKNPKQHLELNSSQSGRKTVRRPSASQDIPQRRQMRRHSITSTIGYTEDPVHSVQSDSSKQHLDSNSTSPRVGERQYDDLLLLKTFHNGGRCAVTVLLLPLDIRRIPSTRSNLADTGSAAPDNIDYGYGDLPAPETQAVSRTQHLPEWEE